MRLRIIGVEDEKIVFRLILEDAGLRRGIAGEIPLVPVEMIRRDVQDHRNVRAERFDVIELKAADLEHGDGIPIEPVDKR